MTDDAPQPNYLDDVEVRLLDWMGSDDSIIQAAQVSIVGGNDVEMTDEKRRGLIGYLMRKKHGSPFEHNSMKFYVKAPIFVFREFMRHRIGFSYNEMSGRYTKLEPEFYVPNSDRPLVNVGTSAHPKFEPAPHDVTVDFQNRVADAYDQAWATYERLLEMGVGNEMARIVLPVGIFSQMYVTTNLRALLNFLSLRTSDATALFPSNPQHEIELVAKKMEEAVEPIFPLAMAAYNESRRVAP